MTALNGDARLKLLMRQGHLSEAEDYCRSKDPDGTGAWGLLRAIVCFLNEIDDPIGYYDRGPAALVSYLEANEGDVDARFWLAYWSLLARGWSEAPDLALVHLLEQQPQHAYANLILAAYRTDLAACFYLARALRGQPGNLRALLALARHEAGAGHKAEAVRRLRELTRTEPFEERGWGILNEYVNGVLTGSLSRERILQNAKETLEELGS
jgi:hypothetical protein